MISKRELLDLTNISYGQLYRWKREMLIPEDWFIKQSVPSGQETFFPKEKILSRINQIIDLKDKFSHCILVEESSDGAEASLVTSW